ncbi:hypothetical protein H0H81_010166 [Sphagnurus paluster]|uniref:Uncharacterized protein n=1 Tax=Sphagnurus paluster TaxID=117069 RepID=A0A9P7FRN6_9AGAR|nr:hypothetical protein H0H81_010166 [Sphagnurus paluster]
MEFSTERLQKLHADVGQLYSITQRLMAIVDGAGAPSETRERLNNLNELKRETDAFSATFEQVEEPHRDLPLIVDFYAVD